MTRQRFDRIGSAGLNTDTYPSITPPEAWSVLHDVVTSHGSLQAAPAFVRKFDLPCKPAFHTAYTNSEGVSFFVVSDGVSIWAVNAATGDTLDITPLDESPGTLALDYGRVTFTSLNGVLVVNSTTNGPFYLPATGPLVPLPGWDPGWRCRQMVSYRYFLVALNMTEGNIPFPYKLRWSSSAAEGEIPAEWVAATSNDAGDDLLGETSGHLVCGVVVRDALTILSDDSAYNMSWVGGAYVMRVDRMHGALGTSFEQGAAEMGGALVAFVRDDLMVFDGAAARSIAEGRVRHAIVAIVGSIGQVHCHAKDSELWFLSSPDGPRFTDALVFNWSENTWWQRSMEYGYGLDSLGGDLVSYDSNVNGSEWWVSVKSATQAVPGTAEKFGIPVEGAVGLFMVRDLWLEADGAPVSVTLGAQSTSDGAISWGATYTWTPGVSRSIPVRFSARYLALRLGLSQGRVGALTIDWASAGQR